MVIEFLKKWEKSKWSPWVGTAPFILIPIVIMFRGELARGVGILAVFAVTWVGLIPCGKLAQIIATRFFKVSDDVAKRLTAAFCAFGFLFIPVLVGSFKNANLGTAIKMHSLSGHFLWACVGAGIFFCVTPKDPKASR